jgi:cobalt/nickel-transporting P-type ATPase D
LCHCDKKKIEWYLSRNLATLVKDEPPTIMLNFVPNKYNIDSTTLEEDEEFYLAYKENKCVVCGNPDSLRRFHVVPSIYR